MANKKWSWISIFGIFVFLVKLVSCSGETSKTEYVPISNAATKVEIVYEKTSLKVGEKLNLHANVTPANTTDSVTWSSSNSGIATVNSYGVVTAVSAGSVKITAKAGNVSSSVTLTVEAAEVETIPATNIKINYDTTSVKIGEKLNLYANVTPANTTDSVTWSTSDSGIATVNSYGVVTAVSAGSVKITAKAGNVSSSVTLTVEAQEAPTIPATNIKINYDTTSVKIGEKLNLHANVTPANTTDSVTWSSSNSGIATVNSAGVVTAVSAGSVKITAKAGNVSTSVTITVEAQEAPTIPATNIKINYDTTSVKIGEKLNLHANVTPANTTDSVIWSTSDSGIATVNSYGVVTAVSAGSVKITAKAGNVSDSITVNVLEAAKQKYTYKVLYYKQKLDNESKYELAGTESGYGEAGAKILAEDYIKELSGFNFNSKLSDSTISLSSDDVELKLYYDRKTYTITFDTDGGSEINSISGKYEATVTAPANPTKKHFTFDGWSPELPSTFTSDVTVKAKWKEDEKGNVDLFIY